MRLIISAFYLLSLLGLFGCFGDDFSPPTIVLTSPDIAGITAEIGDTILFEGTFSDPNELGKLEFTEAINSGGNTIIKTIEVFDSKREHQITEHYIIRSDFQLGDVLTVGFIGYDVPGNNTICNVDIAIE